MNPVISGACKINGVYVTRAPSFQVSTRAQLILGLEHDEFLCHIPSHAIPLNRASARCLAVLSIASRKAVSRARKGQCEIGDSVAPGPRRGRTRATLGGVAAARLTMSRTAEVAYLRVAFRPPLTATLLFDRQYHRTERQLSRTFRARASIPTYFSIGLTTP